VYFRHIQDLFWVAIPVLCAFWALRLWRLGLATRYPLLVAFLVGEALLSVVGYVVYRFAGQSSSLYVLFWPISQVVSSTLSFLVLLQVYQRLVERYEGLRRLGQIALHVALGIACAIVLGSIILGPTTDLRALPGFWIIEERGVYLALTAMSVLLLGFAVFFRLVPTRNVLLLFGVFGLLFAGQASLWVLRDFVGWNFRWLRVFGSSGLYICCFLGGAITFTRAGEGDNSEPGDSPAFPNRGAARLRLEEINQTLLDMFRL
jgi:hypothetical protein